jgi:hypothetical protein
MRVWKMLFVGTILAAASLVAIVHHGSHAFGPVGGAALAVHEIGSRQPVSAVPDPITPSENSRSAKATENEPWGPFRTVDW